MADPTTPDTRLTQAEIQELKRLMEAATPGPWAYDQHSIRPEVMIHHETERHEVILASDEDTQSWERRSIADLHCTRGKYEIERANGLAIAALHNAAPALLALADESSRLREALADAWDWLTHASSCNVTICRVNDVQFIPACDCGLAEKQARLRAALAPPKEKS